jgi:hypothetical protein
VPLSVSACCTASTGRISMKFDVGYLFENVPRKPKYRYNRRIYQAFYLKVQAPFIVSGDIKSPLGALFE